MGPLKGALASLKGSELPAPVLKVEYSDVIVRYKDVELSAHTRGTIASTLELRPIKDDWGIRYAKSHKKPRHKTQHRP